MTKIFKTPFGALGDKQEVPTPTQSDGSVSYEQGFGVDYQRDYEDPQAKDIPREKLNQLFYDVTKAIGELQKLGYMQWQAGQYQAGDRVELDGKVYRATQTTSAKPPAAGWEIVNEVSTPFTRTLLSRTTAAQVRGDLELKGAALRDVGTSAGNVMEVGAFGLGSPLIRVQGDLKSYATGFYYTEASQKFAVHLSLESGRPAFSIVNDIYSDDFYLVNYNVGGDVGFTRKIFHSGNFSPSSKIDKSDISQDAGQSTSRVMSQKAVTDRLFGSNQGHSYVADRSLRTSYVNNLNKPIFVYVTCELGPQQGISAFVGQSMVSYIANTASDGGSRMTSTVLVGAGETFKFESDGTLTDWWEFK